MNDSEYTRIVKAIRCPDPDCKGGGIVSTNAEGEHYGKGPFKMGPCSVCGGSGVNPAVTVERERYAPIRGHANMVHWMESDDGRKGRSTSDFLDSDVRT